jgi:hypothetical protein
VGDLEMGMRTDVIHRLQEALPKVRAWIDQLLKVHSETSRPVASLGYHRLASYYPPEVLGSAKTVLVDKTPFPPVLQFGLPEFAAHADRSFGGITFQNTFFVAKAAMSEALCFHELVHVVQWARLGANRFLLAYALGLARWQYEGSALETMAYDLQSQFERGSDLKALIPYINEKTDAIWAETAAFLAEIGVAH